MHRFVLCAGIGSVASLSRTGFGQRLWARWKAIVDREQPELVWTCGRQRMVGLAIAAAADNYGFRSFCRSIVDVIHCMRPLK